MKELHMLLKLSFSITAEEEDRRLSKQRTCDRVQCATCIYRYQWEELEFTKIMSAAINQLLLYCCRQDPSQPCRIHTIITNLMNC